MRVPKHTESPSSSRVLLQGCREVAPEGGHRNGIAPGTEGGYEAPFRPASFRDNVTSAHSCTGEISTGAGLNLATSICGRAIEPTLATCERIPGAGQMMSGFQYCARVSNEGDAKQTLR